MSSWRSDIPVSRRVDWEPRLVRECPVRVRFRSWFRHPFVAALLGALVAITLPAAAQVLRANLSPGDPIGAGIVNTINADTSIEGQVEGDILHLTNSADPGVALALGVEPGNPPMKVNSAERVDSLNADLLDGFHAKELVRAAHNATNDVDEAGLKLTNGAGNVLVARIRAPLPGVLLINGGFDVAAAASQADGVGCRLKVGGSTVRGSGRAIIVDDRSGELDHRDSCTTTGAHEVPAGLHTVRLRVGSLGPDTNLEGASLTVLFVPFDWRGRPFDGTP